MDKEEVWDNLAEKFDTYKEDIWYGAADNIDAVWPVFLDYIKNNFIQIKALKALEFGCGTGMFCKELIKLGFDVSGIDLSKEMIKIGKKNLGNEIQLFVGNTLTAKELAEKYGKFDLVTAIMVLQFIEEENIIPLLDSVKAGGHIIFANHNPKGLEEKGITDTLYLTDAKIPSHIYPRSAEVYDQIFNKHGFEKSFEHYAAENREFLEKYKIKKITKNPKYMILAYKKMI